MSVKCNCGRQAELVTGKKLHPHNPAVHDFLFWFCPSCDAYVRSDKFGRAMGTLADFETREARIGAYAARSALGLPRRQAHNLILEKLGWPEISISRMTAEEAREYAESAKNLLDK